MEKNITNFIFLDNPIPIIEQEWPENTTQFVSASVLTYNHEPYIKECIEGILMQKTTFPVKIVVFEDCSTDLTAKILKEYELKYPQLFKVFYMPENTWGKPTREEARIPNKTEYSKAKYIALCEGDDYWTDHYKLQKQVDFLEANEDYSLCFHSAKVIDEKTKEVLFNSRRHLGNKTFSSNTVIKGGGSFIPTASMVFTKRILHDLPDCFLNVPVGDLFLAINCAINGKVYYIDSLMSVYRVHDTNWTSNITGESNFTKRYKHHLRMIEALRGVNKYVNKKYKKAINKLISREIKIILTDKDITKVEFEIQKQLYNRLNFSDRIDVKSMKSFPKIVWGYRKIRNFWNFIA